MILYSAVRIILWYQKTIHIQTIVNDLAMVAQIDVNDKHHSNYFYLFYFVERVFLIILLSLFSQCFLSSKSRAKSEIYNYNWLKKYETITLIH